MVGVFHALHPKYFQFNQMLNLNSVSMKIWILWRKRHKIFRGPYLTLIFANILLFNSRIIQNRLCCPLHSNMNLSSLSAWAVNLLMNLFVHISIEECLLHLFKSQTSKNLKYWLECNAFFLNWMLCKNLSCLVRICWVV